MRGHERRDGGGDILLEVKMLNSDVRMLVPASPHTTSFRAAMLTKFRIFSPVIEVFKVISRQYRTGGVESKVQRCL